MQHSVAKQEAVVKVLVMGAGRMGAIRVEDLAADPRVTEVMITNRNQPKAQASGRPVWRHCGAVG